MSILSFIKDLFTPAAKAIDELVTSDEERMKLQVELEKVRASVAERMLEYDKQVLDLQSKLLETASNVHIAESKSESAFTRLYRPIIISCMFLLIVLNAFGLLKVQLPDLFIQIFGASFGVLTLAPTATKMTAAIIDKVKGEK